MTSTTSTTVSNSRDQIEGVITGRVPAGYERYVRDVAEALTEREQRILDSIKSAGLSLGASEEQIEGVFILAGVLSIPEPEPVAWAETPEVDAGLGATLERIERALSGLTEFARQHGYSA